MSKILSVFAIIVLLVASADSLPAVADVRDVMADSASRLDSLENPAHAESRERAILIQNYVSAARSSAAPSATLDRQCAELISGAEAEHTAAVQNKFGLVRRQIDFCTAQLHSDVAAVPKYYIDRFGIKRENRDYGSMVQSLNDAYAIKINGIVSDLDKNCQVLKAFYTKRMTDLLSSRDNLKGQMVSRVGNNRVVAAGTNMYVRNYLNFGGVQDSIASKVVAQTDSLPAALMAETRRLNDFSIRKSR